MVRSAFLFLVTICLFYSPPSAADAKFVQTPYGEQKVVFDFYFDHPQKINSALYWIRSYMKPLLEAPYNQAPEFMSLVVVIHGTEIATVVKKNFPQYKQAVQRMEYYASLGIKFKVCALAADDFGYDLVDFQDFIEVVPSAMTELAHWQLQGYAVITPQVKFKQQDIESIR